MALFVWTCACRNRLVMERQPLQVRCVCGRIRVFHTDRSQLINDMNRGKNKPLSIDRSAEEVERLAAICISCEYFRRTNRGARCKHKLCGCHGKEVGEPLIILHNEPISPQMVNQLKRAFSCPDKKW